MPVELSGSPSGEDPESYHKRRRPMKLTVEIRKKAATHTVSITASSPSRALRLAGAGQPGVAARIIHPPSLNLDLVSGL